VCVRAPLGRVRVCLSVCVCVCVRERERERGERERKREGGRDREERRGGRGGETERESVYVRSSHLLLISWTKGPDLAKCGIVGCTVSKFGSVQMIKPVSNENPGPL
jgi:hypothetical protein